MPGSQVATPSMMAADLPMRVQSASPSYSPSPNRKTTTKGKARASRSPREKRNRGQKNSVSGSRVKLSLPGPFSEHCQHIPARDMEAFVHRPKLDRLKEKETREKQHNKNPVPRPMNAFMLYRSAYTGRCKGFLNIENHQMVSKALGESWKMESQGIRDLYNEWSATERANHHSAFPAYKFTPKKDSTAARRSELTPPRSVSGFGDIRSPPEWDDQDFSLAPPQLHRRTQSFEYSGSRASSPFDSFGSTMTSNFDQSWTGYPSQSLPSSLSTIQPNMLQGSHFEDAQYGMPVAQGIKTDMPSGLNGIPGGSHHDLYPTSQPLPAYNEGEQHMDPQLLQYHQDLQNHNDQSILSQYHAYPIWGDEANYLSTTVASCHSSPAAYPGLDASYMKRETSWEGIDTPASSSF